MYQNLLILQNPRGSLYLLGVSGADPRYTSIGYVSSHDAPEGTVYTSPDAEDPSIILRLTTLTAIKEGWWHWNSGPPAFVLEAPAPFLLLGETHANDS